MEAVTRFLDEMLGNSITEAFELVSFKWRAGSGGTVVWKRLKPVFDDRPFVLHHVNGRGDLFGGSWDLTAEQASEEFDRR